MNGTDDMTRQKNVWEKLMKTCKQMKMVIIFAVGFQNTTIPW